MKSGTIEEGNRTFICFERERRLIFKGYYDLRARDNEWAMYSRIGPRKWLPVIYGKEEMGGDVGIFFKNEGESLTLEEWQSEDVMVFAYHRLRDLHSQNIHHHDVSPRNIVRRRDGSLVLIDFEMAVDSSDCDLGEECPDLEMMDWIKERVSVSASELESRGVGVGEGISRTLGWGIGIVGVLLPYLFYSFSAAIMPTFLF
ncbi:hypothetical protein FA15DRAFT_671823 [Coprinopsis marcescibilis]|uniref:Protein kinase domain-containing protein n=1 Tax=Coprinopsis marcescibilis TaxID=230819 RepID=A0A5C3KPA0_COPMA|nr:hypothetical protein FA15DRAFT_671823 [Coprinopsis marcescibilis]